MSHLAPEHLCILMRDTAPNGWGIIPGKVMKANKVLSILTDKSYEYKFVFDIAADKWNTLQDVQKRALLYHLCCRIDVVENEETGEVKFGMRVPPIQAFPEEMEKYGMWWPVDEDHEDMAEVLTEAAKVR
jgi:hypothetical protein